MAASSLLKFSVPLATNQSASSQGLLMPKMKYRYRVTFDSFGVNSDIVELTKQVKTAGRPKPEFETITLDVYNSKVNLIGKPKWSPINIVIRDDAVGNVSRAVGEQLQKQFDFLEQSSAASGIDYKFLTRIEMLDGGNGNFQPAILETWELYGCYVGNVEYGDLDYGSNDPLEITLAITYDNALQIGGAGGVGLNVGRTQGSVTTG